MVVYVFGPEIGLNRHSATIGILTCHNHSVDSDLMEHGFDISNDGGRFLPETH